MKAWKMALALVLLASVSFAAWQTTAAVAITASLCLIAIAYMIGYGFGADTLTGLAKDEFYQLLALAIMMALFFGTNNIIDAVSSTTEFSNNQSNMQLAALKSINNTITGIAYAYTDLRAADQLAGFSASKSFSCNLLGMGYFVSTCGGYSMLASPFSLAGSIMGFALGEMNAVYRLIELALSYALQLLLPLGIVLRTFRFTRGAGGFLIAFGISLHVLLPAGILFVDILGKSFQDNICCPPGQISKLGQACPASCQDKTDYTTKFPELSKLVADYECSADDSADQNSDNAINTYSTLRQNIKGYLYMLFVKATLGPVVAVLMMTAGLRALSSVMGAEVDVSALARVV